MPTAAWTPYSHKGPHNCRQGRDQHELRSDNTNNKRPLTPKSMPSAGDEHANSKPRPPTTVKLVKVAK